MGDRPLPVALLSDEASNPDVLRARVETTRARFAFEGSVICVEAVGDSFFDTAEPHDIAVMLDDDEKLFAAMHVPLQAHTKLTADEPQNRHFRLRGIENGGTQSFTVVEPEQRLGVTRSQAGLTHRFRIDRIRLSS